MTAVYPASRRCRHFTHSQIVCNCIFLCAMYSFINVSKVQACKSRVCQSQWRNQLHASVPLPGLRESTKTVMMFWSRRCCLPYTVAPCDLRLIHEAGSRWKRACAYVLVTLFGGQTANPSGLSCPPRMDASEIVDRTGPSVDTVQFLCPPKTVMISGQR